MPVQGVTNIRPAATARGPATDLDGTLVRLSYDWDATGSGTIQNPLTSNYVGVFSTAGAKLPYPLDHNGRTVVVPGGGTFVIRLSDGASSSTTTFTAPAASLPAAPAPPPAEKTLADFTVDDKMRDLFGTAFPVGTEAGGLVATPAFRWDGSAWAKL